jgi:branched-subunit amino acid transport protein AzlD
MAQVILVIVVYVLGPALVLRWAFTRYRAGGKPDFNEIVAVTLAVVLIGLLIYSYSHITTDTDKEDVQQIVKILTQRYAFPVKAKFLDQPAVFGEAHARYLEVRIYGVDSNEEQEKIKRIAEKLRKEVASKPIVLNFYREEIWKTAADGSRYPLRAQEDLLRRIHIE